MGHIYLQRRIFITLFGLAVLTEFDLLCYNYNNTYKLYAYDYYGKNLLFCKSKILDSKFFG